jgi:hypothetical protein
VTQSQINEWIAEARAETAVRAWLAQPHAEAEAPAQAERVVQFLRRRFGWLPEGLTRAIRAARGNQLERLTDLATRAWSLRDFRHRAGL